MILNFFYPCIKWLQNICYIRRRIKMTFDALVKRFRITWIFIGCIIRVCRSSWTVQSWSVLIIYGVIGCGVHTKRSVRTVLTGIVPAAYTWHMRVLNSFWNHFECLAALQFAKGGLCRVVCSLNFLDVYDNYELSCIPYWNFLYRDV